MEFAVRAFVTGLVTGTVFYFLIRRKNPDRRWAVRQAVVFGVLFGLLFTALR
jgi:multisubunit Na+/H+ antiporter MnhE subunit